MNHDTDSKWLVIFFNDRLQLGLVSGESPDSFTAGGAEYRETGHGDLTAFYDRLEDRTGSLAGVRLHAVPSTEKFLRAVPAAAHVARVSEEPVIDVYFSPEPAEDIVCTGEQAFGGKWFTAAGGRLALSIDFTYLAAGEDDWRALREAVAEWVPVLR